MTGVLVTAALIVGALLTVLVAPHLLARQAWLRATPGEALFLWQAVSLAGVLFALLAAPVGALVLPTDRPWLLSAAIVVSGLMVVRLLVSGHLIGTDLRRLRAQHRRMVDVTGERIHRPDANVEGVTVLARGNPTAYCLPGRHDRIVLSQAAVERLTPEQLGAVLAHEQAHLDQRHDLLLELFTVLHEAVPRPVRAEEALREAHLLAEMLADRAAASRVGALPLAHALVAMSGAGSTHEPEPAGATLAGGAQVGVRLRAFASDPAHPVWRVAVVGAGLLALAVPWLVLLPAALV
ncbi:M56 family metallopeptidase [Ornithinimicrobium avium]|uniref:M56 family peptidase n=1 Tax=Ornithinimicrobium avium TaxID=2283195 RepID=A0A345NPQ4_9MICO|nr:M56 family metallopeptidase [Ornithinimicrobium avium]AXH97012.1 M56 family peptidase [Ornithinimicrobium avium]